MGVMVRVMSAWVEAQGGFPSALMVRVKAPVSLAAVENVGLLKLLGEKVPQGLVLVQTKAPK